MIKNERQYRITRSQADRFATTIEHLEQHPGEIEGVHPRIAQAQRDALKSQLEDLQRELREYESLRAGEFDLDELSVVGELATFLIKARIARGLSQKDLAERMGLKHQQIQRYEATDYASASLARIKEVASALSANN